MSIQLRDGLANVPLDRVLEDLIVRFLANVPEEDLSSTERVLFQVEEAQWFYTDFLRQQDPRLPPMKMKGFAAKLLEKCPLIWKWGDPSQALSQFGKYKSSIPVRGVALFNSELTRVLLVKGYESSTWSFPRGKISKDESDLDCAVREVMEETGFNSKDLIDENNVIERTIRGKNYKIYLVRDVPEDFDFQPQVRNEIAKIEWHDLKQLNKNITKKPNNYFILPVLIKPLLKWANDNRGGVDEAELLAQAERKLKQYLGITGETSIPAIPPTNDAGRELLDLLQGAKQVSEDTPESDVVVGIPQSMATPYEDLMQNSISAQADLNSLSSLGFPFNKFKFPFTPQVEQSSTPAPESLKKPTSLLNSKELLSVLHNKSSKPGTPKQENRKADIKSNSKAQELLKLFQTPAPDLLAQKPQDSPATAATSDPDQPPEPIPGKVKLLKRPTSAGKEILETINGNQSESKPKSSGQDLLNILKRGSSTPVNDMVAKAETKSEHPHIANPAHFFQTPTPNVELQQPEHSENADFDDFEDFEDFEDFSETTSHGITQTQADLGFDVTSDDETDHIFSNVLKPVQLSHKTSDIPEASSTLIRDPGPVRGNVKLLRPGQSLNEIIKPQSDNTNDRATSPRGNDILKLLNGGSKKSTPEHVAPMKLSESAINAIYGSAEPKEVNTPVLAARDPIASANLLNLLNSGKPPSAEAPTKTENGNHSPASDLLSLLRKPAGH